MNDVTIEVDGLRKRFGPTVALGGMTFTVAPGQDDEIYLVVVEGDLVLQEAVDRGASRAPTGSWAALIVRRPAVRVGGLTLRPAEAAVDIGTLGRIYTLTD